MKLLGGVYYTLTAALLLLVGDCLRVPGIWMERAGLALDRAAVAVYDRAEVYVKRGRVLLQENKRA